MMYADIPDANTVRTVSMIHKFSIREKVMKEIRAAIVDEIDKASREGALSTMLIPSEFRRTEAINKLFSWYDEYKEVLDDFVAKGYAIEYVEGRESKICGMSDSPPYIVVEWKGINLEKGDDK
ncbi:hypothetical protein PHIREBALL_220 [Bacillus phage Phireball]|uniref:Uncharacterized protein n=1 Tax=Bacillus phage SageFayge TaxID=1805954 RepID=A0A143FMX8_9CAUD|nr:hypothetical protein SAGEFAYGE_218 [Bacillus phage SageFayge]AMW63138.1 hypothetical protein SAGEFAYGE_218 [Bacillus phage SageFayge]QDH49494.1 hypothetical protein PHIREBALL_220 [Bacillus phage Phireball]